MPENRVNIELTGSENKFLASLNRSYAAVRSYSGKAIDALSRVNKVVMHNYEKLGALEKFGIGFGVFEMAKDMMEFDGVLRKIGRTSGATSAEMLGLRQQIIGLISPGSGIPLTKGQFAEMAEAMNAAGVSMETIKSVLPQVGRGAVAAHVDVKEYSETIAELMEKYKVAATDLPALQDQLNEALKMEDVRKSPEAFLQSITGMAKTMQLLKTQGLGNVTPLLALQAQLTQFTGSAGEASASIEGLFNGLLRVSKNKNVMAQLSARGINFFNQNGSVKSVTDLIPQFKRLAEEAQKSGRGIEEVAMAVFGRPEAAKALMMIVQRYDEIMRKQEELGRSGGSMGRDFRMESESMAAKLKLFQNQLDKFKVDHMAGMLQKLSEVLDVVNAHPLITKGFLSTVGLMAVVVGLNKVIAAARELGAVVTTLGGKGALAFLGRAGMVGGAAVAGYGAGGYLNEGMGWASGKLTGGRYSGEGWLGSMIYDATHQGQAGAKNNINMTVNVDGRRVSTQTDNMNTQIEVKRGQWNIGD